jgi:hypothetical protein
MAPGRGVTVSGLALFNRVAMAARSNALRPSLRSKAQLTA